MTWYILAGANDSRGVHGEKRPKLSAALAVASLCSRKRISRVWQKASSTPKYVFLVVLQLYMRLLAKGNYMSCRVHLRFMAKMRDSCMSCAASLGVNRRSSCNTEPTANGGENVKLLLAAAPGFEMRLLGSAMAAATFTCQLHHRLNFLAAYGLAASLVTFTSAPTGVAEISSAMAALLRHQSRPACWYARR